jgi:glycosyltransferase involved in cell wall biosynthesis
VLSVIHQDYENVEYIIVDGGSTDGTLDRLRQYEHAIDYWVSEKDGGIYEAMNKGVDLAQGEWIIFMNGGDRFASEHTLSQEVIPLCRRAQSGADSSEGFWKMLGFAIQYDTGEVVRPRFNALMLLHNTLHHQGLFYHHTLFEGFRYDTTQKLISDYELNLSVYLNRVSAHLSNTVVAICSDGGVSRVNADRFRQETNFIRGKCVSGLKNRLFSGLFALKLALHSRLKNTPQK